MLCFSFPLHHNPWSNAVVTMCNSKLIAVVCCCSPVVLTGTQSQLQLERSKSRMGTFMEGGPVAEPNPDEGYGLKIQIYNKYI